MVFCCVFNCSSRSENCNKSFFRIPSIITHHDKETEALSKERRSKWFNNIKRVCMNTSANHYRVCSAHFISSKYWIWLSLHLIFFLVLILYNEYIYVQYSTVQYVHFSFMNNILVVSSSRLISICNLFICFFTL